ncbi:transglycosylase domain-containing protein [Glycomyces rhizosphaerae]|uniref:Transglycosylase domain-containing protein n=1 Tax=Glycomyces rhizosphaerae TaxID=2054422 RepID=A0ABV7PYC0_9ACTN
MEQGRDTAETDDPGRTINLLPFLKRPAAAEAPAKRPRRTKPKHRRKKRTIAAFGLVIAVLATTAFVVGSVFYATVDLPEELDAALSQGSTVYYSDGTTVMGELAAEQRTSVDLDEIADDVENAIVAAEDANFYEHPGVDAKGVLRALVNNVKGGDQQGASTLTQQYVGLVADIRGDGSYLRKAREAAMAMKMEDEYSKDQILNHYLNIVYFGRGAYGVEAAAQEFFGRSAADLSTSQSALLVAQIKSPDGPYDPRDPYGSGGSVEEATERWNYVLNQMVLTGRLDQVKRDAITALPETLDPTNDPEGLGPEGFITNGFVLQELADAGIGTDEVLRGGFDIVTTLDPELQELAVERSGIREVAAADEDTAASLTAVEPGTGRVLAYYGGENGAGLDLAADVGHRPGTSFNTVVFAAAMHAGIDVWSSELDGNSPRQFATYVDDKGEPKDLVNIGGADPDEDISLADAVGGKIDTAVYDMSERLGGDAIARTAAALGVDRMWDPHDLDEHGVAAEIDPAEAIGFHPDIGIGAYPITTLDAASMHAAIAAEGTTAEPFFVETVSGPEGELYDAEPETAETEFEPWIAGEAALPLYLNSFEYDDYEVAVNASSTWHTGFSEGLSLAVWAGDEKKEGDGSSHEGTIAERIWWQVMDGRSDEYRLDQEELEEAMLEEQGMVSQGEDPLTDEEPARQQDEIDAEAAQESESPPETDSEIGDGESSETPDGGDGTT